MTPIGPYDCALLLAQTLKEHYFPLSPRAPLSFSEEELVRLNAEHRYVALT